jgi:hypothetical protein
MVDYLPMKRREQDAVLSLTDKNQPPPFPSRLTVCLRCVMLHLHMNNFVMRRFILFLAAAAGLTLFVPASYAAKGDSFAAPAGVDKAFANEIKALLEAESMLKTVNDDKSAKEVKKKLMSRFSNLKPLLHGTDNDLEELARAQNKVSAVMWEMMKQPYFETENMQELWTVMTHHFARRSANRR